MENPEFNIIHIYTRAQAITDGVLVDISERAAEYGFMVSVAMTAGAWAEAVAWTGDAHQDENARLIDVLLMASMACRSIAQSPRRNFIVYRVINEPILQHEAPSELILTIELSAGDRGEPVLTIMLPNED